LTSGWDGVTEVTASAARPCICALAVESIALKTETRFVWRELSSSAPLIRALKVSRPLEAPAVTLKVSATDEAPFRAPTRTSVSAIVEEPDFSRAILMLSARASPSFLTSSKTVNS
jgi:hypothetical protein